MDRHQKALSLIKRLSGGMIDPIDGWGRAVSRLRSRRDRSDSPGLRPDREVFKKLSGDEWRGVMRIVKLSSGLGDMNQWRHYA